jgi:putative ABC transport system permease protein
MKLTKDRILFNLDIAITAIQHNKVRAVLTALGIIFGVAAVIAMLAIGNGAKKELLRESKLIGVNNIIILPKNEIEVSNDDGDKNGNSKYSPGLTLKDLNAIKMTLSNIKDISPELIMNGSIMYNGNRTGGKIVGVNNSFFETGNFNLEKGRFFNEFQLAKGDQVCILGGGIAKKIFRGADPIGKYVKSGKKWVKVVGVVQQMVVSEAAIKNYGVRDFNQDVYIPLNTALFRYLNRSLITKSDLENGGWGDDENEESGTQKKKVTNQLDKLTIQINETSEMTASVDVISRLMRRRHNGVNDYEIIVPYDKIRQQQKTKDLFKKVLVAIAGISLIVGGIGIMNIMMASVIERTKEIGLRQAVGATPDDVVLQFVTESTVLSILGGAIGIIVGIIMSYAIQVFAGMETAISFESIIVSFGVSAGVGILFGYWPAKKAASQSPINSLRYG